MVVTAPMLMVTWPPANDSVCTLTTNTMMIRRIMSNATMCGRDRRPCRAGRRWHGRLGV